MSELVIQRWNSLQCDQCRRRWPPHDRYETCPVCRNFTKGTKQGATLSDPEAEYLANHYDFSWWLYEHPEHWSGWDENWVDPGPQPDQSDAVTQTGLSTT